MSSSVPPPRRNRAQGLAGVALSLERVGEVDVPVLERGRLLGQLLDADDVRVLGGHHPAARRARWRRRPRSYSSIGNTRCGGLLDGDPEADVQQPAHVGGYDGRAALGVAGLGADPEMGRLRCRHAPIMPRGAVSRSGDPCRSR